MKSHTNQLLLLTLATLLISTSGSLGKFIDLPTPVIIWWRAALGALFLFIFCKYKKLNIKVKTHTDLPTIILGGLLLGAHWITYFYALKLSNVALGMLSRPKPIKTVLLFNSCSKRATIGMLPPLRWGIGGLPKVSW